MSGSEDSYEDIKNILKHNFNAFVHPSLGTDILIALRRSVKKQKLERDEKISKKTEFDRETEDESSCKNINREGSELTVLQGKNSSLRFRSCDKQAKNNKSCRYDTNAPLDEQSGDMREVISRPSDPKVNRGHQLIITKLPTKIEVSRLQRSLVIARKLFHIQGHCDHDI